MHNMSFSGYFMPVSMTPEQTADFWRTNQIDANRCAVMHDANDAFVGMARMGTRGWFSTLHPVCDGPMKRS